MKRGMPMELRALLERFCQLGCLLPLRDDLATAFEDARTRAEAEVVLREMAVVQKQIDNFLVRSHVVQGSE
ncbi:MAG: hypothetical protein AUI16_21480 [Alphaproteobacteria bacterium 13_2_20CM_2_64_7]|jgi:hypothetical protein|nr:MAG: hypothetical protein AUI16_21480 [Alphaproteobacteria bacterium 13_2_20CM_2_64_7]